ncbi:MAG: hypothetical protein CBD97_02165 [Pelagibacteraceae bacterium TMED237]|nr:MAG: hypothetical protein CBD97_02165 [Pelagibacteraceae bacterium TMED237]
MVRISGPEYQNFEPLYMENQYDNDTSDETMIRLFEIFYALEHVDENPIDNIVSKMKKDHYINGMRQYQELLGEGYFESDSDKIMELANIFKRRPANEAQIIKILEKIRSYFMEIYGIPIVSINKVDELFTRLRRLADISYAEIGDYTEIGEDYTWTLRELQVFERLWQNKVDNGDYIRSAGTVHPPPAGGPTDAQRLAGPPPPWALHPRGPPPTGPPPPRGPPAGGPPPPWVPPSLRLPRAAPLPPGPPPSGPPRLPVMGPRLMDITVPEDARPGSRLRVSIPDSTRVLSVVVPEGALPGTRLRVNIEELFM